jgi:hypothetical protein
MNYVYAHTLPDPVPDNAWGARLIVDQGGMTDLLGDRQGVYGPSTQGLLDRLNDGPLRWARQALSAELLQGTLRIDKDDWITLFDDGELVIGGTTSKSHGYFYIAAFLYQDAPHLAEQSA